MAQGWVNEMGVFGKPWSVGVLLILAFAVLGELLVLLDEYVFHRVGINRNALLLVLWVLPILASYIASRYSERHQLLMGLSYVILFPLIGAVVHYISGELGGTVDFVGLPGAMTIFTLYLAVGSILVILGTALGLLLSKRNSES
jgi:hypothetical protein